MDDPRYLNGELKSTRKGMVTVINNSGNVFDVPNDDPRYLNGELKSIHKDRVSVIDDKGNNFKVPKDDSRYLNGEYQFIQTGKKRSEETKKKMRRKKLGRRKVYKGDKEKTVPKEEVNQWLEMGWNIGSNKKRSNSPGSKPLIANGIKFGCGQDAADYFKIAKETVYDRIKNNKYPNWYRI